MCNHLWSLVRLTQFYIEHNCTDYAVLCSGFHTFERLLTLDGVTLEESIDNYELLLGSTMQYDLKQSEQIQTLIDNEQVYKEEQCTRGLCFCYCYPLFGGCNRTKLTF